jgi:thymidylate synthase ThyX
MALDDPSRARIAPYVTSPVDDVFAVVGLPEEAVAALFAHDAQTPGALRETLAALLTEGAIDAGATPAEGSERARAYPFHQAALGAYGFASGAEHAAVHLAIESVSIVASKAVEDLRLGSYTEKNAPVMTIDRTTYVTPPELTADLLTAYRDVAERLLATYADLLPQVTAALRARVPREGGVSDAEHAAALRARAADLLRGLLPAGARTGVRLTANARALGAHLSKLLSHPLSEVRAVGAAMHQAALRVAPALLTEVGRNEYRAGMTAAVGRALGRIYTPPSDSGSATMVISQPVRLLRHDKDALERIALSLSYEAADPRAHASGLLDGLRHATPAELQAVVETAFAGRGPRDPAPRGLEASSMTFELMLDYAAYRDLARHRMLSAAVQRLTCRLGFDTPAEIVDLGFGDPFQDALLSAHAAWQKIEMTHPLEAQYAVPLAYRMRTLWTLDLRELFHVIELRSSRRSHPNCRRIAQGMYRTACAVHPWLKELIRVDLSSTSSGG